MTEPQGVLLTWEAVAALGGVIVIVGGGVAAFVRLSIEAAHSRLIDRLNGKYVSQPICTERHGDVVRRIDTTERGLGELHGYAHSRAHQLANELHRIVFEREG